MIHPDTRVVHPRPRPRRCTAVLQHRHSSRVSTAVLWDLRARTDLVVCATYPPATPTAGSRIHVVYFVGDKMMLGLAQVPVTYQKPLHLHVCTSLRVIARALWPWSGGVCQFICMQNTHGPCPPSRSVLRDDGRGTATLGCMHAALQAMPHRDGSFSRCPRVAIRTRTRSRENLPLTSI